MDITKGFAITLASGMFFGLFGAGVGLALGTFVPDYYRTVFGAHAARLNPVHTGIGLGFSQGLGAGLVIGLIIVVVAAWSNTHRTREADPG